MATKTWRNGRFTYFESTVHNLSQVKKIKFLGGGGTSCFEHLADLLIFKQRLIAWRTYLIHQKRFLLALEATQVRTNGLNETYCEKFDEQYIYSNSNTNPPINLKGNNRNTPIKNTLPQNFWYSTENHVHQHKNNSKTWLKKRRLQFQLEGKSLNSVSAIGRRHRISVEVALKKLLEIL